MKIHNYGNDYVARYKMDNGMYNKEVENAGDGAERKAGTDVESVGARSADQGADQGTAETSQPMDVSTKETKERQTKKRSQKA